MTKKILSILFTLIISSSYVLAADYSQSITPEVALAIKNYKSKNYIGCLQELQGYFKKKPNNAQNQLATYYMAMAFVKTGSFTKAKVFYNRTKTLNPNNTLGKYADKGLVCIEDPTNCYVNQKEVATSSTPTYTSTLDKFINAPYGNGLSSDLNKEIERKRVERLRKEINTDKELNNYDFKDLRNFTNKKGEVKTDSIDGKKLASNTKPSDAEVLQAIKVLNAAGLNNIASQAELSHNALSKQDETAKTSEPEVKSTYKPDITREEYQKQIQREMVEAQMAAMTQPNIGALFGEKNNNQNNMMMNNNMMNMLPFLMAQQAQNGQSNGNQQPMMSPDMMQAMMLNSMMPNFNFGLDNNNN